MSIKLCIYSFLQRGIIIIKFLLFLKHNLKPNALPRLLFMSFIMLQNIKPSTVSV